MRCQNRGLLVRAHRSKIPVLFVQHDGTLGYRLEHGTVGWQIRPELTPEPNEPVVHKIASDSFFQTYLDAELQSRKIGGLIVAGCMTQYCIGTTVRRAVTLGYDATLVADGHVTADPGCLHSSRLLPHHNQLLDGFDAGECDVSVVPGEQVIF